uniref:Uncharacterized protein n=1 Tax=Salix viminalis TaxID=40686 RepID=A0A6N2N3C1_SALVM
MVLLQTSLHNDRIIHIGRLLYLRTIFRSKQHRRKKLATKHNTTHKRIIRGHRDRDRHRHSLTSLLCKYKVFSFLGFCFLFFFCFCEILNSHKGEKYLIFLNQILCPIC